MTLALVEHADAEWIELAIETWAVSLRWDLGGEAVSPLAMQELLWGDVVRQNAVWQQQRPIALLQLCQVDLTNGLASLDVLIDPTQEAHLASHVDQFLGDAFGAFPLRRIMIQVGTGQLDVVSLVRAALSYVVRGAASYPAHIHTGGGSYRATEVFEIAPKLPLSPILRSSRDG